MMKRCAFAAMVAAILLAGANAPAQQVPPAAPAPASPPTLSETFWEERPSSQWRVPEVVRLLTESPWAHEGRLVRTGGITELPTQARYYAEWYSAQVIREALVRVREIQGRLDPAEAQEFLAGPRGGYQVHLFAGFVTESGGFRRISAELFDGIPQQQLQQGATLRFSAHERVWRPDEVELVRDADTGRLAGVLLHFLRAREEVPPEAARGQARLVCPTRDGTFSVSFSLDAMRRAARPDL